MNAEWTAPSADLWRLLAKAIDLPGRAHPALFTALDLEASSDLDALRAAHAEAFATQCAPYVSVYVGEAGQIGGEAAARVADFRRLLGADVANAAPDAIVDVLADYAELVARAEADPQAAHARCAMFWEHIAPWAGLFAKALTRSAPAPFDAWARLFQAAIRAEAESLPTPPALPLHLRAAPEWIEPAGHATHADWAKALLVPVTTGIVLTRSDLARAVAKPGVALPAGGRAAVLDTLFRHGAEDARRWLADEAMRQADAFASDTGHLGEIARFWRRRAKASAKRLAGPAAPLSAGDAQSHARVAS